MGTYLIDQKEYYVITDRIGRLVGYRVFDKEQNFKQGDYVKIHRIGFNYVCRLTQINTLTDGRFEYVFSWDSTKN